MVITKMSGETSWEQNDSIQRAIARIRQMQSVLDLVYKSLLQVRSSNFANAHLKLNQAQFQEVGHIWFCSVYCTVAFNQSERALNPFAPPARIGQVPSLACEATQRKTHGITGA
jgi:hypothetical protein